MRILILFVCVATLICSVASSSVEGVVKDSTTPSPSLLQSRTSTYSAASARASLHAGERASTERFNSIASRAGIDVSSSSSSHRFSRKHRQLRESEQDVMLSIVEKVLKEEEKNNKKVDLHVPQTSSHNGLSDEDKASSMEREFHLLNALMEQQSELREYGKNSEEQHAIAGVSRKFLRDVSDNAIKQ
jgi:hypothetical protein